MKSSQKRAELIHKTLDITPDTVVLLHFDNHLQNIQWLWAIVSAGYLPAISTPLSSDPYQRQQHIRHLKLLLKDPVVFTSERLLAQFSDVEDLRVYVVEGLEIYDENSSQSLRIHQRQADDLNHPAILMLTSGSSGNAKAVSLTASQLLSSVIGKSESWASTAKSVFLNWIGLDHVANLAEIHLHAMMLQAEQAHVQANDLLYDPLLFLHLINKHRVSHTFAPNFFLASLDTSLASADDADPVFSLDLSCLQSIMSGGEANVVRTANSLTKRLNALGVQGQVIRLGYGLTESCAAFIYGMLDPIYEEKERHEFASVGKPINGARVRVSTESGNTTKPYEVGGLELSGPVVFQSYYNDSSATAKAFTKDGWFITGDRAYIDESGKVNLAGRAKELIVINGVKYLPQDIEGAIERANIPGHVASFTAAFSYRAKESQTEGYCIIYGSAPDLVDSRSHVETVCMISRPLSGTVGTRPDFVIPLPLTRLNKSSLGKLSRAKLQLGFENGAFDDDKIETVCAIQEYVSLTREAPRTETESTIVSVLSEMLDLPEEAISVSSTVFETGITSLSLFRFEQALRKRLSLGDDISLITFLSNPILRAIASAIDNKNSHQYNPVVNLQTRGSKTPLWLVHPASGNVLAFLPLSRAIVDRPLFALTARGLSNEEQLFSNITEMSDTYFRHLKKAQPEGSYALTGYSLGTTVAFELAKRLEANGDEVVFCAALDSPPHVIPLVEHLDWTAAAVLVSYFIELISQSEVPSLIAQFCGLSKIDTIKSLLEVAKPAQRERLNLDPEQLLAIVNVTDNFGSMAKVYHPEGKVRKIDVFYCTPLHSVESDRDTWITKHLMHWQDFSRAYIEFHECEGDHADMLNPTYVESFKQRLLPVLRARGI